jgi:A/G-specific adenine glycosylase
VAQHEGKVPRGYDDLRALPGIGHYTANAVRVFAWNEPETLIETNVRAVFIHHFYPRGRAVSDARLLPLIAEAVEGQDPRTWYAALMDYGTFLKAMHPNPSRKSRHHTKQSKFEGSLRQARGEILRAAVRGESLEAVRTRFRDTFDRARVALEKEGLIRTRPLP